MTYSGNKSSRVAVHACELLYALFFRVYLGTLDVDVREGNQIRIDSLTTYDVAVMSGKCLLPCNLNTNSHLSHMTRSIQSQRTEAGP